MTLSTCSRNWSTCSCNWSTWSRNWSPWARILVCIMHINLPPNFLCSNFNFIACVEVAISSTLLQGSTSRKNHVTTFKTSSIDCTYQGLSSVSVSNWFYVKKLENNLVSWACAMFQILCNRGAKMFLLNLWSGRNKNFVKKLQAILRVQNFFQSHLLAYPLFY